MATRITNGSKGILSVYGRDLAVGGFVDVPTDLVVAGFFGTDPDLVSEFSSLKVMIKRGTVLVDIEGVRIGPGKPIAGELEKFGKQQGGPLSSRPDNPGIGQTYFNTSEDPPVMQSWNGTAWVSAAGAEGPPGADGTDGTDGAPGAPGADGAATRIQWLYMPSFSYIGSTFAAPMSPIYDAGAAIDDSEGPFDEAFPLVVPQIAVGDNQANILDGIGHAAGGPAVTVTIYGFDGRGNAQSVTFATNGPNIYTPVSPRAFRLPITRVTTSADLTRKLGVYIGKGWGTASAFDESTMELSMGGPVSISPPFRAPAQGQPQAPFFHGPSGTVVPFETYNQGESWFDHRFKPV